MTSPCETTAYTDSFLSDPRREFQSRTASTARSAIPRSDSPPSPGNVIADGWDWTTFQSGSLASFFSSWPDHSPYRTSPRRSSGCTGTAPPPPTSRSVVSRHRCNGLVTNAASGTGLSRSARARTCAWPVSSRDTPSVQPASTPASFAVVRPWRTSSTVVTSPHSTQAWWRQVGHNGGVIVDCALYHDGAREPVEGDLHDALLVARSRGDSFIWIGLHEPAADELEKVAKEFDLHPLAIEDAVKAHQRPKVEQFDDSTFVVLKTVRYDEASQQIDLGDVMLFLGDSFIVSVRHGQGRALAGVRKRLEQDPRLLACGPSAVLYLVCDAIVDDYSDVSLAVEADIDEVEERVFSPERTNEAATIYNLKREVIEFRRGVRPLVEPMTTLAEGLNPRVDEHLQPFFRDVADHATRVSEQVEGFDDLLTSVLNANLAQVSVQQNSDMRRISAWVAIVAVPTMIAGIYGMNFDHMPELRWTYGYPLALAVMAGACLTLYRAVQALRVALTDWYYVATCPGCPLI